MMKYKNIADIFWISVLFALAFFLRINIISSIPWDFHSDDAIYMSMARSFLEGDFERILHSHWRPFYPFVSAIFYNFTQDWGLTALLVPAFFGSLLVIPIYFLVNKITNRYFAVFACLLIVFLKPLVDSSTSALTGAIFTFLVWSGVTLLWYSLDSFKIKLGFLAGAVLSLAFLTRSEGFLFFGGFLVFSLYYIYFIIFKNHLYPILLKKRPFLNFTLHVFIVTLIITAYPSLLISSIQGFTIFSSLLSLGLFFFGSFSLVLFFYIGFMVWFNSLSKKVFQNLRPLLLLVICFVIGFVLVNLPYRTALNQKYQGAPFLAKMWSIQLRPGSPFELNSDGNSTWAQDIWGLNTGNPKSEGAALSKSKRTPMLIYDIFVTNATIRITYLFERNISPYFNVVEKILLFLGAFWFILIFKKRLLSSFLVTIIVVAFLGIVFFAPAAHERYIYVIFPIFPILTVLGLHSLIKYCLPQKKLLRGSLVVIFAVLFFYIFSKSPAFYWSRLQFSAEGSSGSSYKTMIDRWFLDNAPGTRVMGIHRGIIFYSRASLVYTPMVKDLPALLAYAKEWDVSYIVASPEEVTTFVKFLHEDPKDYPGLVLVYKGQGFYIYKVL